MTRGGHARLYINDGYVGEVLVQGAEDSWSHGEFRPAQGFAAFAPLFGRWSLAMHSGGAYEPLVHWASDELRQVECNIDRLHAKLYFAESGRWVRCSQLNIDGPLIEWKVMT